VLATALVQNFMAEVENGFKIVPGPWAVHYHRADFAVRRKTYNTGRGSISPPLPIVTEQFRAFVSHLLCVGENETQSEGARLGDVSAHEWSEAWKVLGDIHPAYPWHR
jgi:hypothetical protein